MWSERQRKRGQVINECEWVSWANAIVIPIFENTLRTIHIVPAISTPKSAWRSMTQRAAILWRARVSPGSGRWVWTHPDYLDITPSFPDFLLPYRLLTTPFREFPKTRKCCAILLWPFHPNLVFAFRVISIDRVYLVCIRHKNKADRLHRALSSVPSLTLHKNGIWETHSQPIVSPRVRTRGELWKENKLFALACSFTFG